MRLYEFHFITVPICRALIYYYIIIFIFLKQSTLFCLCLLPAACCLLPLGELCVKQIPQYSQQNLGISDDTFYKRTKIILQTHKQLQSFSKKSDLIKYNFVCLIMDFKTFVKQKISYFVQHFERNAILLDYKGQPLNQINLSFDKLSDDYLEKMQELQSSETMAERSTFKVSQIQQGFIKITDKDLQPFWNRLSAIYCHCFNVENQNLTDQTVLKLSQLYEQGRCGFTQLKLSGNSRITQVGAIKLGKALRNNQNVKQINLHGLCVSQNGVNRIAQLIPANGLQSVDLGLIGNDSLDYLSQLLENPHSLSNLSFGEDIRDPWKDAKSKFQSVIRRSEYSKNILSINLYPQQPIKHYDFITEICVLCKKNRRLRVNERQNEFKSASLNPQHNKYYDPDNHGLNAYKFSVKSYLTNVFGSMLDQALYHLEKERRNSLREQAIFQITKQPINKQILQDICTADGSIVVLTKYLLHKIEQKNAQNV